MKKANYIAESRPDKYVATTTRVREADIELRPKAAAKQANKLPKGEQLNKFEQDLEAHDSGNQPA
jgi:hypothetical protein